MSPSPQRKSIVRPLMLIRSYKRIKRDVLPITHNRRDTRRGIIASCNTAPERVLVTLALTDPIVGVGRPCCVTKACASEASAAKPMDAGFARKTE